MSCMGAAMLGAYGGIQSGNSHIEYQQSLKAIQSLQEQFLLGVQDMEAERYDLARQRFEYVLDHDPAFPGAAERLVQVMQVLFATATPTPVPPTATPTPTPDLRPVEDLFAQAQQDYSQSAWSSVIDVLLSLRKADPAYRVVEVDSLLFRSLRYRGMQKIREEANLEGGMYDLSLAERFGPLDATAENWRNLARLYVIGSGFWEVYPEQAVYYFSQVAAAAPGLRDASGWTASGRYWASLVQYGDQLASQEEWCAAQEKYEAAFAMQSDAGVGEKANEAQLRCSPPTATSAPTAKPSATPTGTFVPPTVPVETPTTGAATPTPTSPQPSNTPPNTAEPTATATQEIPPTPTDTQPPPPPTDTEEPPAEPSPTVAAPYPG